MSTTVTEIESSSPPKYTSIDRITAIPLLHDSLGYFDVTLASNPYLRSPYAVAKSISTSVSTSAFNLSKPIQIRLAPYIEQADGYVNKGLDAVQARYPNTFETKPEDVANYARERRQSLSEYASKTYNDNVKTRAVNVAQDIDQRIGAPIVNILQAAASYLPRSADNSELAESSEYHYQRALAISKNMSGNIYHYSSEQFKQLQEHNKLVANTTESIQSVTNLAATSVTTAQHRVHDLIGELSKIRESSISIAESLRDSASSLPISARAREAYVELSDKLSPIINDLREINSRDATLTEKLQLMKNELTGKAAPLLEAVQARVAVYMPRGKADVAQPEPNTSNAKADD